MDTRDVQITGLTGPGYEPTRITIGGVEIPPAALFGLTIQANAGDIPRLTLDVVTLDATVDGKMDIRIPDATHETLVKLGWTPPPADA